MGLGNTEPPFFIPVHILRLFVLRGAWKPWWCFKRRGGFGSNLAFRAGGVLALSPDKGDNVSASAGGIAPTLATFEQCRSVLV
jgi:hypothetical protein